MWSLQTYIGSILIAVNPYTQLDLYNQQYLRSYRNRKFGELEPHTFAIGDNAYQNMLRERTDPNAKVNQCIIIRFVTNKLQLLFDLNLDLFRLVENQVLEKQNQPNTFFNV